MFFIKDFFKPLRIGGLGVEKKREKISNSAVVTVENFRAFCLR